MGADGISAPRVAAFRTLVERQAAEAGAIWVQALGIAEDR
jgi:hypothetical protein